MPGGSLATAYYAGMSETTADTASLNGSAPADDKPCAECVSGGEKALALIACLFGVFIIVMAADMFSGGKITGAVLERRGADE